jgi:hypothetical protein
MSSGFEITLPYAQLAAKAVSANIDPSVSSGTLPEVDGVELSYSVVKFADQARVMFSVIKKPMLVSLGMIESHVKGLLGV